jgi:hypothetical protein
MRIAASISVTRCEPRAAGKGDRVHGRFWGMGQRWRVESRALIPWCTAGRNWVGKGGGE